MSDWLDFWRRHYEKPPLSEREMLWFCARAHTEPPLLSVRALRFKSRKFHKRSA